MINAISGLFGSVLVRLALIFGALATMTTAAIVVSWFVFQSIATNMAVLSEERLPELTDSARVVSVADRLRGVLSDLLVADEPEDLESLSFKTALIMKDIRSAAEAFGPEKREALIAKIDTVEAALTNLTAARTAQFQSSDGVASAVEEALGQATVATGLLAEASDNAFFDLTIGGEETITAIDDTLTDLIEADFALYQSTLAVRAEVNLISGLALGMTQTRDTAIRSILQDLGSAADNRLTALLPVLAASASTEDVATTVSMSQTQFSKALNGARGAMRPSDILSTRQEIDAALSSSLDDIYFELVINSDDAKTNNSEAIQSLLDDQVARIRAQAAVDSAAQSFFAMAMQAALSRDAMELAQRADMLDLAGQRLSEAMEGVDAEITAPLQDILQIADTETGIVSIRAAAFDAQASAAEATGIAAEAVRDIAVTVSEYSQASKKQIEATAEQLNGEVLSARSQLETIGLLSAAIVLLAPVLIWLMVTRPLNRVTAITERLAGGDLSEIENASRYRGEIGRLAKALEVFRTGALERIQLQEEEKKREAEMREAERKAELAQREAEEKERIAEAEREREAREREKAEQAREEASRKVAEAEREERAREQETVVGELASGLQKLSSGDLTHFINAEFPGKYAALKDDYNLAVENLADLIRRIGESAGTIDTSSAEIAASAVDLSRRTENSAATLEETAAALNELTSSVSSAAKGATDASGTVEKVRADAENSETIMQDAVTAMSEIENSSGEIAKIVEVIDSIAFQTNLLALNAGVEAARAGDAGRGFAVVASEVRILAHRCSEAALQINELISASAGHVENGVTLIDKTKDALGTILKGITDVSRNVSDIALSASEQSGGIAEINTAVEALDRGTQQNAAMFEQTTAASQSLTGEASQLSRTISSFRVANETANPKAHDHQDDEVA
ncbi:HAMP domain-containing methyl-accepting chemotaxis protein [uncultured Roseobacter sp.]|uniref:methyl-accepting chemotaxis protein n=1 Tax=uncultured Roseobacter sp. TaxID=114847 RepID=UPI002618D40A|nr:HAMP domain-containing methyl-accepting chemotaxis protein [uncultured Roseobacter sp.]